MSDGFWREECGMAPEEQAKCQEWIRSYVVPSDDINHLYTSMLLWKMMREDTMAEISHMQFKELMVAEGFRPVSLFAKTWEFRIQSAPLRRRPSARVKGWLSSRVKHFMNRKR